MEPTMKRHLALLALAAVLVQGCVIYDHDAVATFQWNVSSCGELAIDRVAIDLFQPGTGVDIQAEAFCEDGAITFDGLEPDTYLVTVYALERTGLEVVRVEDEVSVFAGDNVFSYRF
jgi:hypothetical protein